MPDRTRVRAAAALAWLALAGCGGPAKVETGASAVIPARPVADAAAFVVAQQARVTNLSDFASRGSAEFRWTDEGGDHFEQVQVELVWRERGGRMALRADKLGERLAWLGCDAARWWVFDLASKPTLLVIGPRGTIPADSPLPTAGPESVLELMAARPWPAQATLGPTEADGQWLEWPLPAPIGAWVGSRAFVQAPGALPTRVELVDASGAVLSSSELASPMTVEVRGQPPGAWPLVAGRTRMRARNRASTLDIFWDAPGTDPDRLKDRMFDLEVLRQVLRPEQVEEMPGAAPR